MLNIISLGAGVQSSTMALMAAHGEITPTPDCAIFADTGAEPKRVYEWLDWLEKQLPFEVFRVSDGNIRDDIFAALRNDMRTTHLGQPPFFSAGNGRAEGMLFRKCTRHYKIDPIRRKVRELLGLQKGERYKRGGSVAVQWIGISTDEAARMKPSPDTYITHRWPLIELGMSRAACLTWMATRGYPKPGKSSCTFCPYHDNAMWRDMKENDAESWRDATAIDAAIRNGITAAGANYQLFVHRSLVPLDTVDLRHRHEGQADMFLDECEGMCGV